MRGKKTVAVCHPTRAHYGKGLCKLCYMREYLKTNPIKRAAYSQRNKLAKFGLSAEEYVALVKKHKGRCGICGRPPRGEKRRILSIDHNHKTKQVRGLLCADCNRGLAYLDRHGWLERAYRYLRG